MTVLAAAWGELRGRGEPLLPGRDGREPDRGYPCRRLARHGPILTTGPLSIVGNTLFSQEFLGLERLSRVAKVRGAAWRPDLTPAGRSHTY
jgi:hypothetical protein